MSYVRAASHAWWNWIFSLDRGEWLVLLLVATMLGFLCLRGYGSRSNY